MAAVCMSVRHRMMLEVQVKSAAVGKYGHRWIAGRS